MSYANGTQFYNLPQTVGTDKRDWFDTNAAFAAIDAAIHAAVTGQATDAEAISTINSKLAADESAIAALQTASSSQAASISALQTAVNGQATQIADVRQDAEDMITANNEGAAAASTRAYSAGDYFIYNDVMYKATTSIAIGDTIVPNTNCVATNVDTELDQINSALTKKVGTVIADGVKTRAELLNDLHTFITGLSTEKICHSYIISTSTSGDVNTLLADQYYNGDVYYRKARPFGTKLNLQELFVSTNSSYWKAGSTEFANIASFTIDTLIDVPASGYKLELYA